MLSSVWCWGFFCCYYLQEFNTSGSSNTDSGKASGSLETKYKMKELGLSFSQKWNTDNTLGTEVTVEDQVCVRALLHVNAWMGVWPLLTPTQHCACLPAGSRTKGGAGHIFCTKHRVRPHVLLTPVETLEQGRSGSKIQHTVNIFTFQTNANTAEFNQQCDDWKGILVSKTWQILIWSHIKRTFPNLKLSAVASVNGLLVVQAEAAINDAGETEVSMHLTAPGCPGGGELS